jgi:hypothetical protein
MKAGTLYGYLIALGIQWDALSQQWIQRVDEVGQAIDKPGPQGTLILPSTHRIAMRLTCHADNVNSIVTDVVEAMELAEWIVLEKSRFFPQRDGSGNVRVYITFKPLDEE